MERQGAPKELLARLRNSEEPLSQDPECAAALEDLSTLFEVTYHYLLLIIFIMII